MKYEEEVLKLHSENLNSNIIAKHLKISRGKVYKILKKYNLKSNNNKPKQPRLFNEINISNRKIFDKESVSMITFSKHNDVVKFYKYLYENATIFLTRKRKLFDIYLSN